MVGSGGWLMLAVLLAGTREVMVEFPTISLPAVRVIFPPGDAPLAAKGPFRVRISVVTPVPVAPASRLMLPLVEETPPVPMVRGLWATMEMSPPD